MTEYRHSPNDRHCLRVRCKRCFVEMDNIYDPIVRDVCTECGGTINKKVVFRNILKDNK